jgi:hypothetical protein
MDTQTKWIIVILIGAVISYFKARRVHMDKVEEDNTAFGKMNREDQITTASMYKRVQQQYYRYVADIKPALESEISDDPASISGADINDTIRTGDDYLRIKLLKQGKVTVEADEARLLRDATAHFDRAVVGLMSKQHAVGGLLHDDVMTRGQHTSGDIQSTIQHNIDQSLKESDEYVDWMPLQNKVRNEKELPA